MTLADLQGLRWLNRGGIVDRHVCANCKAAMVSKPGANWAGLICANPACETCDPLELMKVVLGDIEEAFDKQIYPEQVREDFDAPDDREYTVNITAKQWRAIGRALTRAGVK